MKSLKNSWAKYLVVLLVCVFGLFIVNRIGFAVFEWEVPLPLTPQGQALDNPTIDSLFLYIYNFGLGLGAVLAFIRLTMAGIAWGSQNAGIGAKADAMEIIKNAIFGLLLLLFSWVILNTINPQLVSPNVSVLDKNTGQSIKGDSPTQLTAAFKWPSKRGIGSALQHVSQFLIKVKPDIIEKLEYAFNLRKILICPTLNSSLDEVCAKDCTRANFPCDYYQAKCSGQEPPNIVPGCPLPEDPMCIDAKTGLPMTEAQFCMLVWDWFPMFPDLSCGSYLKNSMDAVLPGNNLNGYKEYIKQAGAYFGIDPRIIATLMTSESEELVPRLLTAQQVEDFAAPGGYINVVRQRSGQGKKEHIETWCDPNWAGATGHVSITIKSCNITGTPAQKCTWDSYCKFRGAANNIRDNDWTYKPNPPYILDGFAMTAKISRWIMDGEGIPNGLLNDTLHYKVWNFSSCPNREELLMWKPPIMNPIVFYAIGHVYYGDSISDNGLVPRFLDSSQLEIDTSGLGDWILVNYEKITKVRNLFALLWANAGLGEYKPTESSTTPTVGDFLWWYYDTHSS